MSMHCPPSTTVILPLPCNDKQVWMGMDDWKVMSGLKGQGRCWFGCDVVYQEESRSMMLFGGVAAGLCYTALVPLTDRPVKSWFWFAAHPHSTTTWMDLTEGMLCFPSVFIISLPGVQFYAVIYCGLQLSSNAFFSPSLLLLSAGCRCVCTRPRRCVGLSTKAPT